MTKVNVADEKKAQSKYLWMPLKTEHGLNDKILAILLSYS